MGRKWNKGHISGDGKKAIKLFDNFSLDELGLQMKELNHKENKEKKDFRKMDDLAIAITWKLKELKENN